MRRLPLLFLLIAPLLSAAVAPAGKFDRVYALPIADPAALSPDGKHLAYFSRSETELTLVVIDVDAGAEVARFPLTRDRRDLDWKSGNLQWIDRRRLVLQVTPREILAMDFDGTRGVKLVDRNHPDWNRRLLGPDPAVDYEAATAALPQTRYLPEAPLPRLPRLVALPPAEPEHAYILGRAGSSYYFEREDHALFRVNLGTGAATWVGSEFVTGRLLFDRQGRPRIWCSELVSPGRYRHRAPDARPGDWCPLEEILGPPDRAHLSWGASEFFGSRSIPLGFAADPNVLYLASNVGRDTYGLYAADLRTGRRTGLAAEDPHFDLVSPLAPEPESALVYDRAHDALAGIRYEAGRARTYWLDPELAQVQARLDAKVPGDNPVLEGWDIARKRFLVRLSRRGDAGSFAVYFRAEDRLRIYIARGPATQPRSRTTPWQFIRPSGESLGGQLTLPPLPRRTPVPVVVAFGAQEWERSTGDHASEVAALAAMGYAVLEINHRGTAGLGRKHWLAGMGDLPTAAAEDALLAVDRLAAAAGLDPERIATFGAGFGGLLALRTAMLHPQRINAVVALHPFLELGARDPYSPPFRDHRQLATDARRWFYGADPAEQRRRSLMANAAALAAPVLLADFEFLGQFPRDPLATFRDRVKAAGRRPQLLPIPEDRYDPRRFAAIFVAIEEHFSRHLAHSPPAPSVPAP